MTLAQLDLLGQVHQRVHNPPVRTGTGSDLLALAGG